MSDVWRVVVGALVGYLVGTFPTADLVTRLVTRGAVDIRTSGSGNPGGLNAVRVIGKKWGAVVIVLDAAKGALAGFIGLAIGDAAAYAAGTAVVAGHCWPVWTGFRGGKGVAAAGGSFASVFPPLFVLDGIVTGAVAVTTRRSTVAVRTACGVWVVAAGVWWAAGLSNWWGPDPGPGLFVYAVLGAGMVLWRFQTAARLGGPSL
jgi:acyl phosphate:glycerol-3-phosphate acyltransferase